MYVWFGLYYVCDVKFVVVFDVDVKKVGFDLFDVIFVLENNIIKIVDVVLINVIV